MYVLCMNMLLSRNPCCHVGTWSVCSCGRPSRRRSGEITKAIHGGGGGDGGNGGGGGCYVCLRTFTKRTILSDESVVLNTHVQRNDQSFE